MNIKGRKLLKMSLIFFAVVMITAVYFGCSPNTPCKKCGNTPTKAFKNESSGENEYYCDYHSSTCTLCGKEAKHHYTSLLGIMFVCDGCWNSISGGRD